jgi:16S rRNA (guanine527-N7)-methyltransferase
VSVLPRSLLGSALPGVGRRLSESETELLRKYLDLLIKWQKTTRLVGSVEPSWVAENVFVHSFCFLEGFTEGTRRVADLGSGAGIPGLPIAIVRPDLEVTLIEAKQRRASFLSTVVRELGLGSVTVIGDRIESLPSSYDAGFDAVVMRCAGSLSEMLEPALRLVRRGGVVVVSAPASGETPPGAEMLEVRAPSGLLWTFHRFQKE